MKRLMFIFINVPRKIFWVIFYKWEYLYYCFFYSRPKLEMDFIQKRHLISAVENFNGITKIYSEVFPDGRRAKIAEADLFCGHIFDLLGSGPKKLSPDGTGYQPIDWHSDFKSGYRWDSDIFYRNIGFDSTEGVDIKVPWELSRFQHLNTLGQAYVLTKNRKYSDEFSNQISDWIENNPFPFGVNWKCAMDVAIRVANWLVGMEYFSGKCTFSADFLEKFYASVNEHGRFIYGHLEYSQEITTNHYVADIAGLFFISVYCPFFKESKKWQKFALKELCREMEKQVYSDGCNFEASTSYHRLVLEMFFYCELLGRRADIDFPEKYKNKLKKMFEFSLYCVKPNGMIPQIGDNDSGRFLVFCKRPVLEHKYLLTLAAIYYRDSGFKLPFFDFDEEVFWVFGKAGKDIYDGMPERKEPLASKAFSGAGWYIIRHDNEYCFISCGPNGQNGRGGHAHNDKLSFELAIDGQDVIVDPGTYVYTSFPEERNKFRSTEYHNTVKFGDCGQNEFSEEDLFCLFDRVKIRKAALKETENEIRVEGEIQYSDFTHKRTINLNKASGDWQVIDELFCQKQVTAKLFFHLSPDVDKESVSVETEKYKLEKEGYDFSPGYGVKTKAECLFTDIQLTKDINTITTYIYKK